MWHLCPWRDRGGRGTASEFRETIQLWGRDGQTNHTTYFKTRILLLEKHVDSSLLAPRSLPSSLHAFGGAGQLLGRRRRHPLHPRVGAHTAFQDALSEAGFRREPIAGCEPGTSLPCSSVGVNFSAKLAPRRPGTDSGAELPRKSRLHTPSLPPRPHATSAAEGTRLVSSPSPSPRSPRRCDTSATWRGCRAGKAGGGGRLGPAANLAPSVASLMQFCSAKAISGLEEAGAGAGAAEVLQSPLSAVWMAASSSWPRAVPRFPCLQELGSQLCISSSTAQRPTVRLYAFTRAPLHCVCTHPMSTLQSRDVLK